MGKAFDRAAMERTLASLASRKFLMHNVHDDAPTLFESRWALSYLRGPLTREQIRTLTTPSAPSPPASAARAQARSAPAAVPAAAAPTPRPTLPAGIEERFAAPPASGTSGPLVYEPTLLATASVHYVHAPAKLDVWRTLSLRAALDEAHAASPWDALAELAERPALAAGPEPGAAFAPLPGLAQRPPSYARWAKQLESKLLRERPLALYECRALKAHSSPGESLGDFRARLRDKLHENRDVELERLRQRWAPRLAALAERQRRAELRSERERDDYASKKLETAVSLGASVLGALFGRKLASATNVGRAASVARSAGRAAREREDVERAEQGAEAVAAQLQELEAQFQAELEALRSAASDVAQLEIAELAIAPRKGDLSVDALVLLWVPRRA
jgi:hypothetical protein